MEILENEKSSKLNSQLTFRIIEAKEHSILYTIF